MTRNFKATSTLLLTVLLLSASPLLYSQQSGLQTSFLTSSAIRTIGPSTPGDRHRGNNYRSRTPALFRRKCPGRLHKKQPKKPAREPKSLSPPPPDLLIQQAEERSSPRQRGFSGSRDFERARTEFRRGHRCDADGGPRIRPTAVSSNPNLGRHGGSDPPRRSCEYGRCRRGRSSGLRQKLLSKTS